MSIKIHDELTGRLEELYKRYSSDMTFPEFLEMIIALMEERYHDRTPHSLRNEIRDGMDKGIRPYDPVREGREP